MSRSHAIVAAALLAALACSSAIAGDFVPRSGGSFAPIGGDTGARAACSEIGAGSAMSETDTTESTHVSPGPAAAVAATGPTRSAKHIGVDDVATDVRAAAPAADVDEKAPPPNPHKAKALRWQSLLPGVMK